MTPQALIQHYGSKRQASLELGVSRQTIYNWLKAGRISSQMLEMVRERVTKPNGERK